MVVFVEDVVEFEEGEEEGVGGLRELIIVLPISVEHRYDIFLYLLPVLLSEFLEVVRDFLLIPLSPGLLSPAGISRT